MTPLQPRSETQEVIPEWNIKTILAPVDFSEDSENAVVYAAGVAERCSARLVLVHVIQTVAPFYELGDQDRKLEDELKASAGAKLKKLIAEKIDPSVQVIYQVDSGSAVEEIVSAAENLNADLIVTATHGRTGLKRLFLGNVAEGVIRYARCPVLVIRKSAQELAPGRFDIRKILVALDFSECSEMALQHAQSVAKTTGASLVVAHVAPLHFPISEYGVLECPKLDAELVESGEKHLRTISEKVRRQEITVESEVKQGKAGVEILNIAASRKVDLIVVGTRGLTGLEHVLFGSTAEYVVRHAECPVLVVRQRSIPRETTPLPGKDSFEATEKIARRKKDHTILQTIVTTHPFLANMSREHLEIILKDAVMVEWERGEIIFREGEYADKFYLIHEGNIAVECHTPEKDVAVQTLGPGQSLGWSWLFPPFAWHFQARALQPTIALQLNGSRILIAAQEDDKFGNQLMKRITQVLINRLQETRRRLLEQCEEAPVELGETL